MKYFFLAWVDQCIAMMDYDLFHIWELVLIVSVVMVWNIECCCPVCRPGTYLGRYMHHPLEVTEETGAACTGDHYLIHGQPEWRGSIEII